MVEARGEWKILLRARPVLQDGEEKMELEWAGKPPITLPSGSHVNIEMDVEGVVYQAKMHAHLPPEEEKTDGP